MAQEQVTAASKEKVLARRWGEAASKLRGELGRIAGDGAEV